MGDRLGEMIGPRGRTKLSGLKGRGRGGKGPAEWRKKGDTKQDIEEIKTDFSLLSFRSVHRRSRDLSLCLEPLPRHTETRKKGYMGQRQGASLPRVVTWAAKVSIFTLVL